MSRVPEWVIVLAGLLLGAWLVSEWGAFRRVGWRAFDRGFKRGMDARPDPHCSSLSPNELHERCLLVAGHVGQHTSRLCMWTRDV